MTISISNGEHGKQFTLYSSRGGPNPWKVAIILEELQLSYETIFVEMNGDHKSAPYTDICPNGRMPALIDHKNNNYAIWESGAIVLYLIAKYDTEEKISFKDQDLSGSAIQWLMFQMSGQGPYYGQAVWFSKYHPGEKIESAIKRYTDEIVRVLSVIDKELTEKNTEWLVGDRISYADLSFVPWNWFIDAFFPQIEGWREKYPKASEWDRRLNERRSVIKCRTDREEALAAKP